MDYLREYTQRNLRVGQLKQLQILNEIDTICKKHNIDYWLDGGTLLGAVRHGGFIPWDDDIDIAMTLDDLDRFKKLAPEELSPTLLLQTPENEPINEPIVKVRDCNSLYLEKGDDLNANYCKGIYIDIFPFIDYPTVSRRFVKNIVGGISKSYSILHKSHYYSLRSIAELPWFSAKLACCGIIWKLVCMFCVKGKFFGNIPTNCGYGIMHVKDDIFPLGQIQFEGHTFPAPHNVDGYLRDLYKNYMEIPPIENRKVHAFYIQPDLLHE